MGTIRPDRALRLPAGPRRARQWALRLCVVLALLSCAYAALALQKRAPAAVAVEQGLSERDLQERVGSSDLPDCARMYVSAYRAETHSDLVTPSAWRSIEASCKASAKRH